MPGRIQLSRKKGWRKPEGAVVVARPSDFGNPFPFDAAKNAGYTRHGAVAAFADWLAGNPWACGSDKYEARRQKLLARLPELRGKTLACWCPLDLPCHADVLLELANPPAVTALLVSRPDVLDGEPCFAGTRIAVSSVWDYITYGYASDRILKEFPTLTEGQIEIARALVRRQK